MTDIQREELVFHQRAAGKPQSVLYLLSIYQFFRRSSHKPSAAAMTVINCCTHRYSDAEKAGGNRDAGGWIVDSAEMAGGSREMNSSE